MDAAGAMAFGRPLESFAGAGRMQPEKSVSEALGEARARVAGIGFTHMHVDHTGGLKSLCEDWRLEAAASNPIPTFQGRYQMMEVNHTTRSAKVQLENASCIQRQPLVGGDSIQAIPEFPGLFVIAAAGHTPGSQVFVVQLRKRAGASEEEPDDVETWVVTGDVVNHVAGVELDIPKPRLYSLLLVPENEERLHRMRGFLKQLSRQPNVQLLVSHDLNQIEASGLPAYGSAIPAATEALEDSEP
jgi:glyoxylase-like metal-dependent hydrolase (beta-lactamase superfamily II)